MAVTSELLHAENNLISYNYWYAKKVKMWMTETENRIEKVENADDQWEFWKTGPERARLDGASGRFV